MSAFPFMHKMLEQMMRAAKAGRPWVGEPPYRHNADADEVAVFLAAPLIAAGYEVRFRVATQDINKPFHHVFVEVLFREEWLKLDTGWSPAYANSETYPPEGGGP